MNPKNHALMVKLMNLGVKRHEQQDIPEFNRIQIHPDAISAVLVSYGNDGNDPVTYMHGRSEPPNIDARFFTGLLTNGQDDGRKVVVNRKKVIDILQCLNTDEITLMVRNDMPLLIIGGYDRENVSVMSIIMPRIDSEASE